MSQVVDHPEAAEIAVAVELAHLRQDVGQGGIARNNYGRDHHPRCFSMWLAGGGIRPGVVHGETDDYSYNIVEDPVHIRDLNATILHLLGIDADRLSVKHQGLDVKLVGVEGGDVVSDILL